MVYIGIDPGFDGAFVASSDMRTVEYVFKVPHVKHGGKKELDRPKLVEYMTLVNALTHADSCSTYIEDLEARPPVSRQTCKAFGHNVEFWLTTMLWMGVPITAVKPFVWKKKILGPGKHDKAASIAKAKTLMPELSREVAKAVKLDHDVAEAMLIMWYGYLEMRR